MTAFEDEKKSVFTALPTMPSSLHALQESRVLEQWGEAENCSLQNGQTILEGWEDE